MTKYFVDAQGTYVGGFDGKAALATVPRGATEVPSAPEDSRQLWDGAKWGVAPASPTDADLADSEAQANVLWRAWVRRQAKIEGKTMRQIINELRAELP